MNVSSVGNLKPVLSNELAIFGELERPLASGELAIPQSLRMAGGLLVFGTKLKKRVSPEAPEAARLLTDFLALAEGNTNSILAYAQRFGPLGLCELHAMPLAHGGTAWVCWPRRVNEEFAESIAGWRTYARRVASILSIAATLKRGEPVRAAAWQHLLPLLNFSSIDDVAEHDGSRHGSPRDVALGHAWFLSQTINGLLDETRPRPLVSIRFGELPRLQITFESALTPLESFRIQNNRSTPAGLTGPDWNWIGRAGNLLSAIVLQTAMVAAGHSGLARCDDCGCLYRPKRALPLNRKHFCPECGQRGSRKLYMRRRRIELASRRR